MSDISRHRTVRRPHGSTPEEAPTEPNVPGAIPAVSSGMPSAATGLPTPAPGMPAAFRAAPPVVAAPAVLPEKRRPQDLDGLRGIAEMSAADVHAAMEAFAPRAATARLRRGQRVRGTITRLTVDTAFVDLGEKADASLDRIELPSEVSVGAALDAYVLSTEDGEIRLTLSLGGDATRELLDEAKEHRIPVLGKVTGANDHGLEVLLSGGVRSFCPASHVDAAGVATDLEDWVGRSLSFHVIEVRGREAVVSRRALAEAEAQEEHARALTTLREGDVYVGVVTGLRAFGAFVRILPGVEGLVHVSNIAATRISDPADVLKEGQEVRVRVLSIEAERKRINLGIRQAEDAPAPEAQTGGARQPASPGFGLLGSLLQNVRIEPAKPKKPGRR